MIGSFYNTPNDDMLITIWYTFVNDDILTFKFH